MRKMLSMLTVLSVALTAVCSPTCSMLGAQRSVGGGTKLPYDAEVEYLESTGTQWIDTGITMDYAHTTFGCSVSLASIGLGGFGFGFALTALADFNRSFNVEENPSLYRIQFNVYGGTSMYGADHSAASMTSCEADFTASPHRVKIGTFETTFTSTDWDATHIFAFGTGTLFGTLRIAEAWIKNDGVSVRDFIPVRFTNEQGISEGAMYDRVSGQLFRNQGTGSFVIGPDKH